MIGRLAWTTLGVVVWLSGCGQSSDSFAILKVESDDQSTKVMISYLQVTIGNVTKDYLVDHGLPATLGIVMAETGTVSVSVVGVGAEVLGDWKGTLTLSRGQTVERDVVLSCDDSDCGKIVDAGADSGTPNDDATVGTGRNTDSAGMNGLETTDGDRGSAGSATPSEDDGSVDVIDIDIASEEPSGQPYPSAGWQVSASVTAAGTNNVPAKAIDGQIATRWTTGAPQSSGEWFLVDMGRAQPIREVVLDDSSDSSDYPQTYQLEVSTDGVSFQTIAMGTGTVVTTILLDETVARYVRIDQTGMTMPPDGAWWSIDELRVYP